MSVRVHAHAIQRERQHVWLGVPPIVWVVQSRLLENIHAVPFHAAFTPPGAFTFHHTLPFHRALALPVAITLRHALPFHRALALHHVLTHSSLAC